MEKQILLLAFLLGISAAIYARKVTLIKIGGNATIYATNSTTQPTGAIFNTSGTTSQSITYNEASIGTVSNWSQYFNYFSTCINEDVENENTNVEYRIEIESPYAFDPMIIGEQYIDANWEIASTKLIYLDGATDDPPTTPIPIHKVTINGVSGGNIHNAYF
ncbi:hypothetical protein EMGBS15_17470 [Filimonas sp.]|nr:hypothetical protein EMGBS15_17470 [Filimonas sp.]